VTLIDPGTGSHQILAGKLPIGVRVSRTPETGHLPTGVAIGEGGMIFVTSDRNNSVLRLVPDD